jgi:hypothetical protein
MKKESKEMLKTILHHQELIMKALKIEMPEKQISKDETKKIAPKKAPLKKTAVKVSPSKLIAKKSNHK